MDKLAAMKAFVAIADHGSLTAAADALDKAPPTMVRTLATLEQHLGVRLLNRTTRRMALTEEGRVFLERSRRILTDVDETERVLSASTAEPRGDIRATAPVLFGSSHVAPTVSSFVERFPEVRVDLLLLDRIVDLVEEGIDVGVRIGQLPDSSMMAMQAGTMRRVVVGSPSLIRRLKKPRHPSDLADLPTLSHRGTLAGTRWTFQEKGRSFDVHVRSRLQSNVATPIIDACTRGVGFGRFLAYQVEEQVKSRRLRIVLEDFEPQPMPVQVVYPDARLMSSRIRAFVDSLRDDLSKTLARAAVR